MLEDLVSGAIDDDSLGIGGEHGARDGSDRALAQWMLEDLVLLDGDQIGAQQTFQPSAEDQRAIGTPFVG